MLLIYENYYTILPDEKKYIINSIIFQHGLLIKRDPDLDITKLKKQTKEVFFHYCMMKNNCNAQDREEVLSILRQ